MAGGGGVGRVFGGGVSSISCTTVPLLQQNQRVPSSSQPFEAFFISGSSPSYLGSSSMVSFEDVCGGKRSERSFFCTFDQAENVDEDFDDYFHQPEKKRRLTVEQVRFLEKSFESENKLEPERKNQLAEDLGLQPRQVAIWFQNRRARWKTKQLEKDFDTLQAGYNSLKVDYDDLLKEKEKLQAEVVHLTEKLHMKEKQQRDHTEQSKTFDQSKIAQQDPIVDSTSEGEDQNVLIFGCKAEDLNSAKSDVIDSDSPQYNDHLDHGSHSYAFEAADHSDISQEDEDYLSRKHLLPSSHVLTIEDVDCPDPPSDPCNFGLPTEVHHDAYVSLFWPYWDINLRM